MSWFVATVYDRWMRAAEAACLAQWRAELLRGLGGEVLEVGAGTGANLPHYTGTIERLVLAEPDLHMRRRLEMKCQALELRRAEISDASLDGLPMPDASFDCVVCMLVLCSVPNLHSALAETFRVLRPGGTLLFLEHVAASNNPARLRWQERVEPIWKHVSGNCHLTRRTEEAILASGFQIERISRESMRKAMPLARPSIRGAARKHLS